MAKDHNLISVVDVGFEKGLLLKRTAVDKINVFELRNLVPNLRVNLVSSSLVWLPSDYYNFLKLNIFLEVLCSQWHYETLDSRVNSANYDMVFNLLVVFQSSQSDRHGASRRGINVIILHHEFVF